MLDNNVQITSAYFDAGNNFGVAVSVNGRRTVVRTPFDRRPTNAEVAEAMRTIADWVEKQPDVVRKPRIIEEWVTSCGGGS